MATSAVEMSDVDDTIDQLAEKILSLKSIAIQCRATMIVYNAGQVNRIQKLYDLVDSLSEPYVPGRLFVSSGKFAITSLLPDSEVLKELVVQNRIKLKAVDEIASSKKTEVVKFKGSKLTTSNRSESKKAGEISLIRTEVKNILVLLDTLAVEIGKNMPVLNYYGQMKQLVHYPLQTLSTNLRNLPSLSEAASHRDHEVEQVRKAELQYNNARKVEIVAVAAQSSQEAAQIENLVQETVEFLRALGKEEVLQAVNESFVKEQHGSSAADNGTVDVKRYTACNTIELLKLCANEYVLNHTSSFTVLLLLDFLVLDHAYRHRSSAFVEFIQRLQRLWPSIEKSSQAVGRRYVIVLFAFVCHFSRMPRSSVSVFALCSVSRKDVEALLMFDVELFVAYAVDWQERVVMYGTFDHYLPLQPLVNYCLFICQVEHTIDSMFLLFLSIAAESTVKKADFMRAYELLCQGRATYDKARHRLDLAVQRHSEALSLHREANAQVNQLKDRFIEVCNIKCTD